MGETQGMIGGISRNQPLGTCLLNCSGDGSFWA